MSTARPQFSIDDAFELSLEDAGPGPESSGIARFGPLHFERRARFEVADEDKQSRLRYQNLENDEDGAQASPEPDGGVSTSWTQHPLIQKNCRVVLASFLLLLLGLGECSLGPLLTPERALQLPLAHWAFRHPEEAAGCHHPPPPHRHISARQVPCSENTELVLILTGVGLEVAPSPGERPASAGHRRPWQARPPPSRKGTPQSRSLPRDLHLLRGQGPPRLPVLLPALLREVSRGELRDPASAPSSCAAPWHPQRALLGPAAHSVPSSLGKSLSRTLDPPLPLGSLLRKFGAPRPQPAYLGLGKSPRTGSVP
ncbi:transmembrane protein 134 isoform X3 [Manis pentadactyla]|uniref:transmembrane protein 134 isoform X3 n=1 Tax=Manis pentadactyla TaxID=143292 RepID=UPI00255C7413|nr:transmembrane protein 134 isoform X3 [Manis pentadactyla]